MKVCSWLVLEWLKKETSLRVINFIKSYIYMYVCVYIYICVCVCVCILKVDPGTFIVLGLMKSHWRDWCPICFSILL
jgi:glycopeptide antibiotics resistance protein